MDISRENVKQVSYGYWTCFHKFSKLYWYMHTDIYRQIQRCVSNVDAGRRSQAPPSQRHHARRAVIGLHQCVVCHVSRRVKSLWLYNVLIWHSDCRYREKPPGVWRLEFRGPDPSTHCLEYAPTPKLFSINVVLIERLDGSCLINSLPLHRHSWGWQEQDSRKINYCVFYALFQWLALKWMTQFLM